MHCPECGFINNPGANFCQKCGAHLDADGEQGDQTTITYKVGETGELQPVDVEKVAADGGALVIRSGGGRSGESFGIEGERMTIGRSPDAGVAPLLPRQEPGACDIATPAAPWLVKTIEISL